MKFPKLKYCIALAVLLVLSLVCLAAHAHAPRALNAQEAAARWRGESETDFVQLSCFFPADAPKTREEIYQLRQKLAEKLDDAAIEAAAGTQLFADAWSAQGKLKLSGAHGSSEAAVLAVGGDFFTFHPMVLCAGSFFSANEPEKNCVVLDEQLAWQLFGSSDLVGMEVEIGEQKLTVVGVVRRETDAATQKVRGDAPLAFLPYDAYLNFAQAPIDCYEMLVAEPLEGFGLGTLRECLGEDSSAVCLQNTGRFSLARSWETLRHFDERAVQSQPIAYPYWENAARTVESRCALDLALALIFAAPVALVLCIYLVWAAFLLRRRLKQELPLLRVRAAERLEARRGELYERACQRAQKKGR